MRVGFTGHQNLGPASVVKWLSIAISDAVKRYNVTLGYTSLAAGADQLFAGILYEQNIPYVAVIPSAKYEGTFTQKDHLDNYLKFLSHAQEIYKLKFNEPSEIAYYEAGKEVVNCSEVIFSVWNGKPAKGLGGTADIVKYAIAKSKKVVHFNPETQEIVIR